MPNGNLTRQVRSPHSWQKKKKRKQPQKPNDNKKSKLGWLKNLLKKPFKFLSKMDRKKLILVGVIFVIVIITSVSLMFAIIAKDLPKPGQLIDRFLPETTKIYDRSGEHLLYEIHGDQNRTFVSLDDIPGHTVFAFVALEDKNFFQHSGLSVKHIVKATILYGLKKIKLYRGLVPGGSTLTQQFVKNAILTPEKSITRKFKEWILAYQVEKKYTKEQILEFYFNEIPFGSTSYGIESAAQNYFGKRATELSLPESATLAAMVQRPTYYSPYGNHVEELIGRKNFVLNEMVDMGFITEEEAEEAKKVKLDFKQSIANIQAPHFVLYVKEQLTEEFGERLVEQGGLKVITTLEMDKQLAAEKAVTEQAEKNIDWEATNASLVSINPKTGEILAMVGSKDFFDEEIDGQVNISLRERQPGSSFKPIVYTTAWQQGYYPETVVFDVITKFKTEIGKDYEPHNYDDQEHGPVSLRKALQGSLNISAVKTNYITGVQNVLDLAEKLGYSTFGDRSRFGLSLVLGGGEVTLLEHVAAFGTLAREGEYQKPFSIISVENPKGKKLFEHKIEKPEQVIDKKIARITNDVLSDDSARSYVFGAGSLLTLPDRSVAAKTGTTNDYRDAWTVGYTPSLVTGVWVGNNDNSAMKRGASGYTVATPIWHNYMTSVLTGSPVETFNTPEYELPEKPMLNGSLGLETKVNIDKITGLLATTFTPESLIEEKVYREFHNILYFINIDNPAGPIPGSESNDTQYDRWEEAIITWAGANDIEVSEQPPTEYEQVHTAANKPTLAILDPTPDQTVTTNLDTRIEFTTVLTPAKVEYYLDDILILSTEDSLVSPLQQSITLPNTYPPGDHYLKVVIYDEVGNSNLDWLKIVLE